MQKRLLGGAKSDRKVALSYPTLPVWPFLVKAMAMATMACRGILQSSQRVMFCSGVIEGSAAGPAEVLEKDPSPLSDR